MFGSYSAPCLPVPDISNYIHIHMPLYNMYLECIRAKGTLTIEAILKVGINVYLFCIFGLDLAHGKWQLALGNWQLARESAEWVRINI